MKKHQSIYIILLMIIGAWGTFVMVNLLSNPTGFISYLGFTKGHSGTTLGWVLALMTAVLYSYSASQISEVKYHMFRIDALKLLSIVAAVFAGITEEVIYRKWVMDFLDAREYSIVIQILASGLAFGVVHLIWGIKHIKAGINAFLSTFLLGAALAIVYTVSERSLAPCIVAHIVVTALIEPGMLIAAKQNKLDYW